MKSGSSPASARNKPAQAIRTQLGSLAHCFEGFEQQIQNTKDRKRDNDEQQVINMKVELQTVNQTLTSEIEKRNETVKAIGSMFDSEIKTTRKAVENSIYGKIDALIESIHDLSNKLNDLDEHFEEDRNNFPKKIDEKSSSLLKQIEEFKAIFNSDMADTNHKDEVIHKIIDDQNFNINQMIEAERVEREQKMLTIQNDIDLEARMRSKASKSIRECHKENMNHLHVQAELLQKERKDATDEICKALVHYTAALHDGVKMASEA